MDILDQFIKWTNANSGLLSLLIFIGTLTIGWVSGLFKLLRKRPKFKIEIMDRCSFGCVIDLKREHNGFPVHKTAIVLDIKVSNIGNASSSIGAIKLGYLTHDRKPKWRATRKWIKETISKSDFCLPIGEGDSRTMIPFLRQSNYAKDTNPDLFLEVGKSSGGIVYFEEEEAFGSWMPRPNEDGTTNVKITVMDVFGKRHSAKAKIPLIDPNKALQINPFFAQTYIEYFSNKLEESTVDDGDKYS